jgi:hypothetical protein
MIASSDSPLEHTISAYRRWSSVKSVSSSSPVWPVRIGVCTVSTIPARPFTAPKDIDALRAFAGPQPDGMGLDELACEVVQNFRYAVMPIARKLWFPILVLMPVPRVRLSPPV